MSAVLVVQGGGCRALTLKDEKILQGGKSKASSGCKTLAVWAVFCSPASAATPVLWVYQGVRFPVVQGAAGVCFGPGRALQWCCEVWQNKSYRILQAAQPVCSWGVQPGDLPKTPGIQQEGWFLPAGWSVLSRQR